MKKLVVFPGWASEESFYKDILGDDILFINEINLKKIYLELDRYEKSDFIFVAWSMGTINLIEILNRYLEAKAVVISPTLNFAAQSSEKMLNQMIDGIKIKKDITLKRFLKLNFNKRENYNSYIENYFEKISEIDEKNLIVGLNFLKESSKEKIELFNKEKHIIVMASEDKVISEESSMEFAEKFKNKEIIKVNNSGHNILYENKVLFEEIIGSIIDD